jgi:6,7-dimethyl-8-ribityllumazine synthase
MIAVIQATFNHEITDLLTTGCLNQLKATETQYELLQCPGAVELVGYSKKLMDTHKYTAIIVIGAVIKGDTDHYEYVCQYVTEGMAVLSTQAIIPLIFGVLTTQTEELAHERAALDKMNKGKDFADTAIFMIDAFKKVKLFTF